MKNILILIIKGMIIGIGQIIPGVSGGMLAITLGVYEKGINAISNIFKDIKDNIKFLFSVGIGILISVIFFSKIIKYSLINFYLPTMLLFIGLILGGLPSLITEIKNYRANTNINKFITTIIFILIIFLSSINSNNNTNLNISFLNYLIFFIIGIIYAATMVIPGVSGTAIMMMIGYYETIINIISNLNNFSKTLANIRIIIPFVIGLIFGIIIISKLMNYLLSKHKIKTYYAILGLVLSSVVVMFLQTIKSNYTILNIIISLLFLNIGYFISKKLEK